MKKLTFLFILALFATGSKAQHVLQFNQALLVTTTQTVQTGHIWKIEGVFYSSTLPAYTAFVTNTSVTTSSDDIINVGGTPTTVRSYRSQEHFASAAGVEGMTSTVWQLNFPMWLPAGTSLAASTGVLSINVMDFIIN